MKKILIVNGPNLNLLGNREKKFYGDTTLEKIKTLCDQHCKKNDIICSFFQSNHEGELIEKIHSVDKEFDGIIINPAAFTHTSVAIRDALSIFKKPIIELHISNIYKREDFRRKSLISAVVTGIICGLGVNGYILAIYSMHEILKNES